MVKRSKSSIKDSKLGSPSKHTSSLTSHKASLSSKCSKSESNKKTRYKVPYPASTVTTLSTSVNSLAASQTLAKSSRSNHSHNCKASKGMKSLSIRSKPPPLKQPDSPPKIFSKTSLDPEISIDYLNCSYCTVQNSLQESF